MAIMLNRPSPMHNQSNVCYANSVFQMLFSIPELRRPFFSDSLTAIDIGLERLYSTINQNPGTIIETWIFLTDMIPNSWSIMQQQDAHEFLMHIIENTSKYSLKSIFKSKILESIECISHVCLHRQCSSTIVDNYMVSLSVEITKNPQSIENLLTKYFSREQLSDYVCGKDESQGCKLKDFHINYKKF